MRAGSGPRSSMRPGLRRGAAVGVGLLLGLGAIRPGAALPPPRPRPDPPSAPVEEGQASAGLLVLTAPGAEAILVRAGSFQMGASELEVAQALAACRTEPRRDECTEQELADEYPPHEVWLSPFWIDRREVTVARYRQCVTAGRCTPPPFSSGGQRFDQPDLPVSLVTWQDARTFCLWAGGRLPTEAEWERAARGTSGRRYPWGNVYNPFLANHGAFALVDLDGTDGFLELAPVGSFPNGRTPDGIEDLAGNVEEWVADWYAPEHNAGSEVDPQGPDVGDERVIRGGSYARGRTHLRTMSRDKDIPGRRSPTRGFRCARSASR
ncbi:MAG: SUMF1/EgtB/PvdO family nonheme iron enzyme [Byssovorax sp.]